MGKVDKILKELAREAWRTGNRDKALSIDNNFGTTLEIPRQRLLELLKQAAPEKYKIPFEFLSPSEQADIAPKMAFNKGVDDYLANIHKLFKGEE